MSEKVVLVTGASRKIGAAVAEAFGKRGASVVVNYLQNRELAERAAKRVETAGGRALIHQADVRDRAAVREMVARAVETFGGLDFLINNARLMHTNRPFMEVEWERDLLAQFEVHVGGALHCCQEAVPHMKARGGGAIVNMLTAVYRRGRAGLSAYGAAKAALRSLTINLAAELGPDGIRVNAISPGTTASEEFPSGQSREQLAERIRYIPLGRLGAPEDVAETAVFLCSDASRYVTSADIPLDGGWGVFF